MTARLPALLLACCAAGFGADRDFDLLVKRVESRLGVQRTRIPFLGVANLFVKVARPAGTSGFRLAVFEDVRLPFDEDRGELDRIMAEASTGMHPLVKVRSRRNQERTYIYARDFGKTTKMLIATFESDEATIMEVKLKPEALLRTLQVPSRAGKIYERDGRD